MSDKDYKDYINDIVDSINYIKEFTDTINFEQFQKDIKTRFAVIRCFEIIGEAVKRIPEDFRNKYPFIPWKVMSGMRDRLIHGYDTVDVSVLWRTIKNNIPELEKNMKNIKL